MTKRPALPQLYEIPQQQIEEVARDLRWENAGCKVYYAVDAKDVIDFCFPLGSFDLSVPDLDGVAADQAALDFIFRRRPTFPLLLPHYVKELGDYFDAIQNSSTRAYEDLEMWRRMRFGLPTGGRAAALEAEGGGEEFDSLKKNIVRKLAVWLGVDSIGVDRFKRVLQDRRLLSLRELREQSKDPDLDEIMNNYKPAHADEIFKFLQSLIPPSVPAHKRAARVDACRRDAMAIDWVLYLNSKCATLKLQSSPVGSENDTPRYFFLYLSSAHKTEDLFTFLKARRWYPYFGPDGGGQKTFYHCHRNRKQTLLVGRTGWGTSPDEEIKRKRASDNLEQINAISKMISERTEKMEEACNDCILAGGQADSRCAWREVCQAIRDIEQKTADVPDLGLIAKLREFDGILKSHPRLAEKKTCLEELDELLRTRKVTNLALRRVFHQQTIAEIQSKVAAIGFEKSSSSTIHPSPPDHLLPLTILFPKLHHPYDRTQALIAQYASLDPDRSDELRQILIQAVTEYVQLDVEDASAENRDHDLARMLLNLAFGGTSGYYDVLDQSEMLRKSIDAIRAEPYYFLVCSLIASLRLQRNQDVHKYVTEGLRINPAEAFLYHARAFNTFSWRRSPEKADFCPKPIASCIEDENTALQKLNLVADDSIGRTRLKGAILNNLAFMQCFSQTGEFKEIYNLVKAQESFQQLLEIVPQHRWRAIPRFHHTEAYLEYQLARQSGAHRIDHLQAARSAITAALEAWPTDERFLRLQKQIEEAISHPAEPIAPFQG